MIVENKVIYVVSILGVVCFGFKKDWMVLIIIFNLIVVIMKDVISDVICLVCECLYGWFGLWGLWDIFRLINIVKEVLIFVKLFKLLVCNVLERVI